MSMINLVVDSAIPFIKGVFEPYTNVRYIEGKKISKADLEDTDGMIIRTRTKCNKELLEGTKVKIISTATIGLDHIDTDWCDSAGILVTNAAGCNAGGVMQYVFSALYGIASRKQLDLRGKTIGIVGVGNVGKRVEKMAQYLGFKVLKYDPPREKKEGPAEFCSLDYLLKNSDIVTMHIPLEPDTKDFADKDFFSKMKRGAIFINAARGEVVDENALLASIPKLGAVIIDTWKNEPDINRVLLEKVDIATPHIAGYSYQGKQNATSWAVRSVSRFFGIKDLYDFFPKTDVPDLDSVRLELRGLNQGEITAIFQYNYPIFTDDFMFRVNPESFEELRSNYNYRREVYI